MPGDPAAYFASGAATAEAAEQMRKQLGLDKSLLEQFFLYRAGLSHGDFGTSLDRLRRDLGLSTLFVSHDLNVVRLLTDRVAVMYLGKIVEMGPSQEVFSQPAHPCTQALVSAIRGHGPRVWLDDEVQSPINPPPQVCRFASRCPAVQDRCRREAPALQGAEHVAASHFATRPQQVAA